MFSVVVALLTFQLVKMPGKRGTLKEQLPLLAQMA